MLEFDYALCLFYESVTVLTFLNPKITVQILMNNSISIYKVHFFYCIAL